MELKVVFYDILHRRLRQLKYMGNANMVKQEALLLQTDRATRCQSKSCQLLHNCRNKLYNKSTTNESNGQSSIIGVL